MAGQEIRNHRIGPGPIGLHDDDLFALERGQDVFLVEYEGLVDLTGKAPFSSDVDENGMALADQLGDGGFIEGRPQAVEGACALCCFFEVFGPAGSVAEPAGNHERGHGGDCHPQRRASPGAVGYNVPQVQQPGGGGSQHPDPDGGLEADADGEHAQQPHPRRRQGESQDPFHGYHPRPRFRQPGGEAGKRGHGQVRQGQANA